MFRAMIITILLIAPAVHANEWEARGKILGVLITQNTSGEPITHFALRVGRNKSILCVLYGGNPEALDYHWQYGTGIIDIKGRLRITEDRVFVVIKTWRQVEDDEIRCKK